MDEAHPLTSKAAPQDPAEIFGRAVAMMKAGRLAEALAGYEAVLTLVPGHLPSLNNRGIVLDRLGRHTEALASFDQALAIAPADPLALNNRGEALQKLMRGEESLASYDAAIAAAPDFAEAHANRGHLLAQLGRTEEAIQALEQAIGLDPGKPRFYQHLAPLRRFGPGDPDLARMQALSAGAEALSLDNRIDLGFALAKALADVGEHDRAFEQLSAANRLKRSTFSYDEAAVLASLERTGEQFGEGFQAQMKGAGDPGPAPILIVGMPRSGSTLVEQILASHPKVFGAGESPALQDVVAEALQSDDRRPYPDGVAQLSPEALAGIASDYLRRLGDRASPGLRLVDKALSNFRYLGLVHAALPNARFIRIRRNPVDACMSCYRLLFGGNQPFAYDLGELGRYHRALDRLMDRWRDLLPPGVLLELEYEALVSDSEPQVRRLLDHCGLDWDERCLSFHETDRQVRTSSASQVRQPLNAGAIGASEVWRPYIARLLEALGSKPHEGPAQVVLGRTREVEGVAGAMEVTELERKAAAGDVGAQRALADSLDAAGRHTDAIDWLARAAQTGDVEALTQIGLRLLIGKDAPLLPNDGARMLANAADLGGVEAMERMAVLIGGGFYARQSWAVALDLLAKAAAAGSLTSQAQLELLAAREANGDDWSRLAGSVDMAHWTKPAETRTLSDSPRILAVSAVIPPEVCDWVIAQSASRLAPAELYDPKTGRPMQSTETRLNRIAHFNLAGVSLAHMFVQARMAATIGAPMQLLEPFAVLHYATGEEYGEHYDYLDPAIPAYAAELAHRGQRVATCLIYLNDDYEGGETEFPQLGIKFKGGKGDALIFFSADAAGRPDPRTVHAGRTPTSGEKWLLSQFFRNRPVVGA
jgi:tetratricopeptide (TPR) repeat protein